MTKDHNRRDLLKYIGASTVAVGLGTSTASAGSGVSKSMHKTPEDIIATNNTQEGTTIAIEFRKITNGPVNPVVSEINITLGSRGSRSNVSRISKTPGLKKPGYFKVVAKAEGDLRDEISEWYSPTPSIPPNKSLIVSIDDDGIRIYGITR